MTYYYLDPSPAEVPRALQAVVEQGLFENDNAQAPLTGFFTGVFKANPSRYRAGELSPWGASLAPASSRAVCALGPIYAVAICCRKTASAYSGPLKRNVMPHSEHRREVSRSVTRLVEERLRVRRCSLMPAIINGYLRGAVAGDT